MLHKNNQLFKLIMDTSLEGFWVVDINGKFIEVNDAYCQMIGYSRDELLDNLHIWDIDALESLSDTKNRINYIVENKSIIFETKHKKRDGNLIDFEISVSYIESSGKYLVCFCRDVTERKKKTEEINALLKSSRAISIYNDFEISSKIVLDTCKELIRADFGCIYVFSNNNRKIKILHSNIKSFCGVIGEPKIHIIKKLIEKIKHVTDAFYVNDCVNAEYFHFLPIEFIRVNNLILYPLKINNTIKGIIVLANKIRLFDNNDTKLMNAFGEIITLSLKNSRLLEKIENSEYRFKELFENMDNGIAIY